MVIVKKFRRTLNCQLPKFKLFKYIFTPEIREWLLVIVGKMCFYG